MLAFVAIVLFAAPLVFAGDVYRPPMSSTSYPGQSITFFDDFDKFSLSKWSHESTVGGGGNWEFEWYTNNRTNSYTRDSLLYIKPTLSADQFGGDSALNTVDVAVWGSVPVDQCTSNMFYGCERTGGAGGNIFNPIQSAAVRSLDAFTLQYGRIEVSARLPLGDWLWPAIWMMPRYNEYGIWPASGEIDIVESRGNDRTYGAGGADKFGSTLHFGPTWQNDAWQTAHAEYGVPSGTLHDAFHIFGFYWDNTTLYSYIDKDSNRVLEINTTQSFWNRGEFPSNMNNPWVGQPNIAPFNQEYFLIFNVAVGGVNGYFPDNVGSKPWTDTSSHAANDFYAAKANWYATWKDEDAALQIDWVKVYQSPAQRQAQREAHMNEADYLPEQVTARII